MKQSRKASFVEALANTLFGLVLAFIAQALLLKAAGVAATTEQNLFVVVGMTLVSMVRSYVIRRLWNNEFWKTKKLEVDDEY